MNTDKVAKATKITQYIRALVLVVREHKIFGSSESIANHLSVNLLAFRHFSRIVIGFATRACGSKVCSSQGGVTPPLQLIT
jgi:hypothetical protein